MLAVVLTSILTPIFPDFAEINRQCQIIKINTKCGVNSKKYKIVDKNSDNDLNTELGASSGANKYINTKQTTAQKGIVSVRL